DAIDRKVPPGPVRLANASANMRCSSGLTGKREQSKSFG
ncbi:unnamed protein product, partial [marine sediment metagenome]